MATLYWSPNSPFVKKVSLALRELGLEDKVTIKRGGGLDSTFLCAKAILLLTIAGSCRSDFAVTSPTLKQTEHDQWNPSGKVSDEMNSSIHDS